MNISLPWLREYLPDMPPLHEIAEALTMAGLPTENFSKAADGSDVMDVEVTSNRGDCLSHVGIARELASLLNLVAVEPTIEASVASGSAVAVTVEDPQLCPYYSARVITGVKIGPSPEWLRIRLEAVGIRPINNVVDVTNFVLFELGQPLHAFDLDKLSKPAAIHVRNARAGETLVTIDGHTRKLEPWMLVIADANKPLALAGVMGGKESEVTDGTTSILLESARFDALSVRRTSRALQLRSDSSHRFERGIPATLPLQASARAVQLILQIAGGASAETVSETGSKDYTPRNLSLRYDRLRKTLGIDLPREQVVDALKRLRMNPQPEADAVAVTVPPDRIDVNVEIDLVEEVARVVGYAAVPERDTIRMTLQPQTPLARATQIVRDHWVSAGAYESVTFSFVADAMAQDFLPPGALPKLPRAAHTVRKSDGQLRPSLLPGLLEAVVRNQAVGNASSRLFETGSTFYYGASQNSLAGSLIEARKLAVVFAPDTPATDALETVRALRGLVGALLRRLAPTKSVRFKPAPANGFSSALTVLFNEIPVGVVGIVSNTVAEKIGLRVPPAAAELDLAPLLSSFEPVPQLKPLAKFPGTTRDVSLLLAEPVTYAQIESILQPLNLANLEELAYVTTYRGKPLEKGTKSLTVSLNFRSDAGTLKAEEVDASVGKFVDAAKAQLGATLRT